MKEFDFTILGAGSAGFAAAIKTSELKNRGNQVWNGWGLV